jgi:hypothetical protein
LHRPQAFLDACFNMQTWPTVLANATYLGAHGDLQDSVHNDETLANCFAQMNARGVQLSLEVGSVKPGCPMGGNCYSSDYFHWVAMRQLGAPLTVLRMDEPLNAVMFHPAFDGNHTMAYAVNKTADWIQQVRSNPDLSGMTIVDIEPYPAGFPGNAAQFLATWMVSLRNECAARGIACPEVFELDYDPYLSGGSVADIQNVLVPTAHSLGQSFSYIYTNTALTANSTDNCTFAQAVQGRASALGFAPDWFTVESWDPNPSATVPEKGGGCTLMSAAKLLIDLDYYPWKTVVLYDDSHWNGDGFGATIGDTPFVGWEWNDRVGSLRIPAGVSITLYEHSDFGGASISFTGPFNLPDLTDYPGPGGTWNNSVSSVRVFLGGPPPGGGSAGTASFQAANGQWVVAEDNGNSVVNANRNSPGPWETFNIWDVNGASLQSGDSINIVTSANWCFSSDGETMTTPTQQCGSHETFVIEKLNGSGEIHDGDLVAIRAWNSLYMVAEDGGGSVVNANRQAVGSWETFTIRRW